jgi:WD40 repeat protein
LFISHIFLPLYVLRVKIPGELCHSHAIYATCFSSPLVYLFTMQNTTFSSRFLTITCHASYLFCCHPFQGEGTLLATGSYDGQARIWSRDGRWTTVSLSMFCCLWLFILMLKLVWFTIWGCRDCVIIVFDVSCT